MVNRNTVERIAKLLFQKKSMILRLFTTGNIADRNRLTRPPPSGSGEENRRKQSQKGNFNRKMSFAIPSVGKLSNLLFIACIYLFLYVPIIVLLIFSFNTEGFPSPWKSFTLKWYHELFFESSHLWHSFMNSLIVAIFSTLISLAMGVFLIFYGAQGGRIGKFLNLFYANLVIPETVLAVSLLGFFSLFSIPLGLLTLILAHSVLGLGFVIPIVYARFLELDLRITEASLALGATPFQTFFKVTLPLLRPSLIATGLLVFIISFDDFILSYFCTGSSSQTLSLYILSMLRSGISPVVNALSAILLILSSLMVFFFFSLKTRSRIF